jgi:hypothetical protein
MVDESRESQDDATRAARDSEIERTTEAESSAARLFDVRRVIGALFTLYGVLVLGAGLLDGDDASKKASGIDINIWTGLGMLLLGILMLVWMKVSPPRIGGPDDAADDGADRAGDERPAH